MAIDLSSQVVAVTGASSGIGEATALACARAGAAVALAARRAERIEALARAHRRGRRPGDRRARPTWARRPRRGLRRARARRARPPGRARQQRRRDAARPDRERAHGGMAADDPRERVRRALLHPRRAAADARAGLRPHRQRQLGRRPRRARGLGRLQPDEVRRRGVLGVAAPGGRGPRRARHARSSPAQSPPSSPATTAPRSSSRSPSASTASRRSTRRGHRQRGPLRDRPAPAT